MLVKSITRTFKGFTVLTAIAICMVFGIGYFANRVIGLTSQPTTPGTPKLQLITSTTPNTIQINVGWRSSTEDTTAIQGYELSRSTDGTNFSVITTGDTAVITGATATYVTSGDTVSYTDTVGVVSSKYYYRVRAYDVNNVFSQPSGVGSTYVTGPKVTGASPQANATDVSIKPVLQFSFDQDIDPLTVNTSTITIREDGGGPLSGTVVTYDSAHRIADLSIMNTLITNKKYILEVTTGVKNTSGLSLATGSASSFTTGSSNNYPHGSYSLTTGECSNCHKSHTASGPELITQTVSNNACFVCHNGTQSNQIDYYGQTTYQNYGHASFDQAKNRVSTDCGNCHTPHGSSWPKLLTGNYDLDASSTKTDYSSDLVCTTSACHPKFTNLSPTSLTSFNNGSNQDLHYEHLVQAGLDKKGDAVCYECHRPHGPIASEIVGADQNSSILGQVKLIGFPSTATVIPVQGTTGPTFVLNPVSGRTGGGCTLSCHGVTHVTDTPSTDQIDSRYDNTTP